MIQSLVESLQNFKILNFFSGIAKNRILDHYNKPIPIDFVYKHSWGDERLICNIRINRIYADTYVVSFFVGIVEQPDFISIQFKNNKIVKCTREHRKTDNEFPYMDVLVNFIEKYKHLPNKRNKAMEERIKKYQMYQNMSDRIKLQRYVP